MIKLILSVILAILIASAVFATDPMDARWTGHGSTAVFYLIAGSTIDSVTEVNSTPFQLDEMGAITIQYFARSATNDSVVVIPILEASNWNVDSLYVPIYTADTLYAEITPYTFYITNLDTARYLFYRFRVDGINDSTTINPTDTRFWAIGVATLDEHYQIDFIPETDAVKADDYKPNIFSGDRRD